LNPRASDFVETRDPFKTIRDSSAYLTGKLVGGNIPLPVANHLQLLALYRETSIQKTLQTIIEEWCSEKETIECIIETLADRAFLEWTRRLAAYPNEVLKTLHMDTLRFEYLEENRVWLQRHKITDPKHIKDIIYALSIKMGM